MPRARAGADRPWEWHGLPSKATVATDEQTVNDERKEAQHDEPRVRSEAHPSSERRAASRRGRNIFVIVAVLIAALPALVCALGLGAMYVFIGPQALEAPAGAPPATAEELDTLTDPETGLTWTRRLSPAPLTWQEAQRYCQQLPRGDAGGWRLPTRRELQALVRSDDTARKPPLRDPFADGIPPAGTVVSGELVQGRADEPWGLDLQTGQTFNAAGYDAYVRCVR
jgi:hypothetical protein